MSKFPLYELIVNNESKFLSRAEAIAAYDNGWVDVSFGFSVIEENGTQRKFTVYEMVSISNAADEYSGNK